MSPVNVLCLKWGSRYPASYVNILHRAVKEHLGRPFRFVCVTDDPSGLEAGVEAVPFPADPHVQDRAWPNIFVKLLLFRDGFADLRGPTLFLDIDLLVVGDLDRFFDYHPGEFCIIHNWIERRKQIFRRAPAIGNSSCFRFDAGASNGVYEVFLREKDDPALRDKFLKGSQKFQTYAMGKVGTVTWWPSDWVCSFKRQCIPPFPFNKFLVPRFPKKASVIAFHGRPDIDEAIAGYRGPNGPGGKPVKTHLTCLPTPWIAERWHE